MDSQILFQYLLYMDPVIGLPFKRIENCFIFNSQFSIINFNRVYNNGIASDSAINDIKKEFGELPFNWYINSNDLLNINALEKNKFKFIAPNITMAQNLNLFKFECVNPKISIQHINFENINDWIDVISSAFNMSKTELPKVIDFFGNQLNNNLNFYVGYYENKPVCAAMLIKHNDIASLHCIGTVLEFRKRGFGFAITHKVLSEAKAMGCSTAILFSTESGIHVYERLGFIKQDAYYVYASQ